jgi:hypothetical protein
MDDKECFASITVEIGKSGNTEVLKHNGRKMKSRTSKQQQLIKSHTSEVNHELLDDIDLDVLETVNRYAYGFSFNHFYLINIYI